MNSRGVVRNQIRISCRTSSRTVTSMPRRRNTLSIRKMRLSTKFADCVVQGAIRVPPGDRRPPRIGLLGSGFQPPEAGC